MPFFLATINSIRVKNLEPNFSTLFMVWVSFKVIFGYDVIIIMCTVLRDQLKRKSATEHPPFLVFADILS